MTLTFAAAVLASAGVAFSVADAGATRRLQPNRPAAATDKPDFSGRWILDAASQPGPDVPRTLTVRQVLRRTNFRGDPIEPIFSDISIERELERGIVSESHTIGVVGGTVSGIANGRRGGAQTHYAVKWDGSALIFEAETRSGATGDQGPWTERREVWSFDDAGLLKVAIAIRSSDSAARSLTLLYRRALSPGAGRCRDPIPRSCDTLVVSGVGWH